MRNKSKVMVIVIALALLTFLGSLRATYGAETPAVEENIVCLTQVDYNNWVGLTVRQQLEINTYADQLNQTSDYAQKCSDAYVELQEDMTELEGQCEDQLAWFQEEMTRPLLSD